MTEISKSEQLQQRTIVFSVSLIKQLGGYSKSPTLQPLINQIIKSATSIGANYAEAVNGSSRADFRSKVFIAKKEAAETRYWLEILQELLKDEDLTGLKQEAKELNLIMQKIVSTIRSDEQNGKWKPSSRLEPTDKWQMANGKWTIATKSCDSSWLARGGWRRISCARTTPDVP